MPQVSLLSIKLMAGAALTLCFTLANAVTPASSVPDILTDLNKAEALVAVKRGEAATLPDSAEASNRRLALLAGPLQMLGNRRMFVGDSAGALDALDESGLFSRAFVGKPPSPEVLLRIEAAAPVDAVTAIVNEARHRQVVILNESHHMPMHRAFAMVLARELRKIGYTHLAAETFNANVMSKGYVGVQSGFYTRDPVYANFVRDAAKDGWKFVEYEAPHPTDAQAQISMEERARQREEGQARNLVDRILATDPKAKIFIYVGYGHAMKATIPGGMRMMGDYFKEFSGIDPLTVDQSLMFAHARPDAEHFLYKALSAKGGGKPIVLRGSDAKFQVFASPPGSYDMQVIHPAWPSDPSTGRGAWLSQLAGFSPHAIPAKLMPASGRRLVMAMRPNAGYLEIPLDVVLLEAGKKAPMLMLPAGPFELMTRD